MAKFEGNQRWLIFAHTKGHPMVNFDCGGHRGGVFNFFKHHTNAAALRGSHCGHFSLRQRIAAVASATIVDWHKKLYASPKKNLLTISMGTIRELVIGLTDQKGA